MYRIYEYQDFFQVVCTTPHSTPQGRKKGAKRLISETVSRESVCRARSMIRKYVECGNFNYFVTLTFSPRDFDRHDLVACREYITAYLSKIFPDSAYVLVPELHDDGALHFHGFMSIDPSELSFAGFKRLRSGRWIRRFKCNTILNDIGVNAFERILDNKRYQISYVLKYVTKKFGKTLPFSCLYFNSRGLKTPKNLGTMNPDQVQAFYNFLNVNNIHFYNTRYMSIWTIPKDLWQDFQAFQWVYFAMGLPDDGIISPVCQQISFF